MALTRNRFPVFKTMHNADETNMTYSLFEAEMHFLDMNF